MVKISSKTSPFKSYTISTEQGGLQSRLIRGFCEQDDGTFLVASETHGIIEFDKEENRFSSPYTVENSRLTSDYYLFGNILHTLNKDWKCRIWAGYHRDGFNVIIGQE